MRRVGVRVVVGQRTRSGDLPGRAGSYDASGYVREVLPREGEFVLQREDLEEAISELRRFLWFDEHTRMAVISFALYNGNYNLYSAVRFIFEVTPGGAIVPSYSMRVLKLDLYDNVRDFNQAFDNYLVIVDIALYTLVFRLLILEFISWARIRWRYGTSAPYLSNIWNVMELVNITPFSSPPPCASPSRRRISATCSTCSSRATRSSASSPRCTSPLSSWTRSPY